MLIRRTQREQLAAALARQPHPPLRDGAYWQMFNGENWVGLLATPAPAADQIAERWRRASLLAEELGYPGTAHGPAPFDDHLYRFGHLDTKFVLVGDRNGAVHATQWCRCPQRRAVVAFERWDHHTLLQSGTIHSARRCRRLARLD